MTHFDYEGHHAKQMWKLAMLGQDVSPGGKVHIRQLAEETSSKIVQNPNLCKDKVVADASMRHQLTPQHTSRLVEATNHALAKKTLNGKERIKGYPTVNKQEVAKLVKADGRMVAGASSPGNQDQLGINHKQSREGKSADRKPALTGGSNSSMVKTAQARNGGWRSQDELAGSMMGSETMQAYLSPLSGVGEVYHPLFDVEPETTQQKLAHTSKRDLRRAESYAHHGLKAAEDELSGLQQQHPFLVHDFVKTAEQHLVQGADNFNEFAKGCLMAMPSYSTAEMLKLAADRMHHIFKMSDTEHQEYIDAFNLLQEPEDSMGKFATGVGVSESLVSTLNGRVKLLNGDSLILKKLRAVGENENAQRLSMLKIKRLGGWNDRNKAISKMVSNQSA